MSDLTLTALVYAIAAVALFAVALLFVDRVDVRRALGAAILWPLLVAAAVVQLVLVSAPRAIYRALRRQRTHGL